MSTGLAILWVVVAVLGAPLLEGMVRKIKAFIHSRRGPPLTQPYLDLAKLLIKEDLSSDPSPITRFGPLLAFASVLAAAFFVPPSVRTPGTDLGDVFVFIYLMTLSAAGVMAGALSQSSPFSHVGGTREMMMVITTEAVMLLTLLIFVVSGGSALPSDMAGQSFRWSYLVGLLPYLFAMQALIGKLPFDTPEAEQEIMEGPFIEYSGPSLALLKWSLYVKQVVFGALFFNLFVGWPAGGSDNLLTGLAHLAIGFGGALLLGLFVVLVDATNPRLRIDQSLRFFAGLIGVALVAVGLAAFGL